MKNPEKHLEILSILMCGVLLMTGCSKPPSPSEGESMLREQIDSGSQGQIKLVGFKKTDGEMSVVNDVKVYELDYKAEIEFQADGTWFKGMVGMGFGFSNQQAAKGSIAAFANQTVEGGINVSRGDHVIIDGVMHGEKKESGWVFEIGDSHVASGPFSPEVQAIQKKAQNGEARAESELGVRYLFGRGVETNYIEAVNWFRKAADKGDLRGENALGMCLRDGNGVEKDVVAGTELVRKAAEGGFAGAQVNMGDIYTPLSATVDFQLKINGVVGDMNKSLNWYRMAAQQNFTYAEYKLGKTYERACYNSAFGTGLSSESNALESVKWYQKVIDSTNSDLRVQAQMELGEMYLMGLGVRVNYDSATNYFNQAAAAGSEAAKKRLTNWQEAICIMNLKNISKAKFRWALENGKPATDAPTWDDIKHYLKNGDVPQCPSGGTYIINSCMQNPTCSIEGHNLP